MKIIILFTLVGSILISCVSNQKVRRIQKAPSYSQYIKFDTVSWGDDRFHDDDELGYAVYGITAKNDTLRVKWIPRKRWH